METVSEASVLSAAPSENPWERNSAPASSASTVDVPSTTLIDFEDASWPALSSLPAAQAPPPPPPPPSSVQQTSLPIPPPPVLPTPVQPPSPAPEPAAAPPAADAGAVRPPAALWNPHQRRGRSQRWAPNPRHGGSRHPPDVGDLVRQESSQFYNQGYLNGFPAPPEWRYRPSFGVSEIPPPTNWPPPSAGGPPFPPPYGVNVGAPIYWPPYHSPYPGGYAGAPPYRPPHHSLYGVGHASAPPPYGPPHVDHYNSFYPGPYGGEVQILNGYPVPSSQPVEFHHQMTNQHIRRSDSNWNQHHRSRNALPRSSNNHIGQEHLDREDNQAGVQHQTGQQDSDVQSESPQTRVRKQIEYYFCDQNLEHDNYLKGIMDAEGWVDIHTVANFRMVRRITGDIKLVHEAMQSSDSVELRDDKLRKRSGWEKYILASMQNLRLDE